jgi:benzoate/toluate 1,2-dioxygenase beta subunit
MPARDRRFRRSWMMAAGRQDIESFLYYEARLIDEHKLDDWLSLFTDDARYWVPCNRDSIDPMREVSIIYDDRQRMGERVWRIQESDAAYAQEPRSKTRHLISNVELVNVDDEQAVVSSNFSIFELRRGTQTAFAGRFEHHLRRADNGWKIAFKKVELLNNNETIDNLTFIL